MDKLLQLFCELNIEIHDEFMKEFVDITSHSGQQKVIINRFVKMLEFMRSLGDDVYTHKEFERLTAYGNLCAMHVVTQHHNLRVLYSQSADGKLFFHIFHKRDDSGINDYEAHAPIAKKRRAEMLCKGDY